jgi:hypothetical protein
MGLVRSIDQALLENYCVVLELDCRRVLFLMLLAFIVVAMAGGFGFGV